MTKFLYLDDVYININKILFFEKYGPDTKLIVEGGMIEYIDKPPIYVGRAIEELTASRNAILDFNKWYDEKYSNK